VEIRDILIAWLALGFAFSLSLVSRGSLFGGGFNVSFFLTYFVIALVTVGPGFVFHELSHKFVAQRYGFWAEFRMWPMGLLLALLTSLLGVIFAAPGATYISGMNISEPENGKISLAGPAVNVGIGLLFLPLALFGGTGFYQELGFFGSYINFFLALFNLIPFGPLDGSKVLRWSTRIWVLSFIPLGVFFLYLFFLS
jgi:Zn-dependent protease